MRSTTFLRSFGLFSAVFITVLSTPAQDPSSQQTGDPMAAAARKARAEQQNAPKPKKVYTNDDFAPPPAAKATDGKPSATQADAATTSDADLAAENNPKSEIYWRKRFSKVRDKLATSEKELSVLQRELDKNEVQYYPDPQKALMQQYTRKDINENRGKIDAKQKEVDALKKQLSDMEDELRRAGGDPGWAR